MEERKGDGEIKNRSDVIEKQKRGYEMIRSVVGSEMSIRDRSYLGGGWEDDGVQATGDNLTLGRRMMRSRPLGIIFAPGRRSSRPARRDLTLHTVEGLAISLIPISRCRRTTLSRPRPPPSHHD